MTREQALEWILSIADTYENSLVWDEFQDDEMFQMGIEYGIVIALTKAFGFTKEDVDKYCCEECEE